MDNYFNGKEVHRTLFLDPSLFEREQQQVFAASWCYLGHESLVPETGDFFTGDIAGQPLAMVRQKNGEIVVLHNRCPHKGVKVLAEPQGNVGRFIRCPYHAWTFKTDGQLLSIPVKKNTTTATSAAAPPTRACSRWPRWRTTGALCSCA